MLCLFLSIVLLVALLVAPACGEAVTVQTRFQFPAAETGAAVAETLEGVALAGLSSSEAGFPNLLGLVWTNAESSSWFPGWELQLHGDRRLFPAPLEARAQESRRFGTAYVKIGAPVPQADHVYETILSYDTGRGSLSVFIADVTANEVVYKGLFELLPLRPLPDDAFLFPDPEVFASPDSSEAFFPSAGFLRAGGGDATAGFSPFEELAAHPRFVPRAVEWRLVETAGDGYGSVPLLHLDREAVSGAALALSVPERVAGTFRLHLQQDGLSRVELLEVAPVEPHGTHPLDMSLLPPGRFDLVLEYHDAGRVWFSEIQAVTVGRIEVEEAPLTFEPDTGVARGTLLLKGDGPFPGMWVTVEGELLRKVWDEGARSYRDEQSEEPVVVYQDRIELTSGAAAIPVALPVPAGEPGLWQVRWRVTPEADVPVFYGGAGSVFATYTPVRRDVKNPVDEGDQGKRGRPGNASDPDASFTVAVLPDTQYYTYRRPAGGHPDIFLRQAEWIAENAARENIVLALHLGDITDHNRPSQWEVAQRSLRLLDGVVPYVLTIGNHDMGADGRADSRETLFNEYFPPAQYAPQPGRGGLFHPDELQNSYYLFSLGGDDYLVLALEFLPRDEVLEWANAVAAAHPDHRVIVITHYYTSRQGSPAMGYGDYAIQSGPPGSVNSGEEVWQKFLRKHPNIFMVLSGHLYHDAVPREVRRGDHGNPVYQLLFDYQGAANGGDGWLALLRFFPERQRIGVAVYSPYLGAFKDDRTDGFAVPFCIDLAEGAFVDADRSCAVEFGN